MGNRPDESEARAENKTRLLSVKSVKSAVHISVFGLMADGVDQIPFLAARLRVDSYSWLAMLRLRFVMNQEKNQQPKKS